MNAPFPTNLFAKPLAAMADLSFRPATTADFRILQETCYADQRPAAFLDHFEQMMVWQGNGRACWLIIERGDRLVGSGELIVNAHQAELANLFVVPPYRGRGIGTAMIIVLSRLGRYLDLTGLDIGVACQNERALALYRRLGFTDTKEIELPDGETAVILHKKL